MDSEDSGDVPLNIIQNRLTNHDPSDDSNHTDAEAPPHDGSDQTFDPEIPHQDMEHMPHRDDTQLQISHQEHLEDPEEPPYQESFEDEEQRDEDGRDEEGGDEDDVPLSSRVPTLSRLKKRREPKRAPEMQQVSDSDDDVPLATKLKRSHKVSRPSRRPRKPTTPKRERDTRPKSKKIVKRTPRAKKEEDAPTRKFEKLGQRREIPPDNDPSRLFYQSMYHEKIALRKTSFTADSWMLRNGLLEDRDAEKVMARWDLKK